MNNGAQCEFNCLTICDRTAQGNKRVKWCAGPEEEKKKKKKKKKKSVFAVPYICDHSNS